MTSKIRCQKEKINTQAKVSDQGLSLGGVVSQAENIISPHSRGETAGQGPGQICSVGRVTEKHIVVVKCMGGP